MKDFMDKANREGQARAENNPSGIDSWMAKINQKLKASSEKSGTELARRKAEKNENEGK